MAGSSRSSRIEIDEWFARQRLRERDRAKRKALLLNVQQKVYDEAYFLPIWQLGFVRHRPAGGGLRLGADSRPYLLGPL